MRHASFVVFKQSCKFLSYWRKLIEFDTLTNQAQHLFRSSNSEVLQEIRWKNSQSLPESLLSLIHFLEIFQAYALQLYLKRI